MKIRNVKHKGLKRLMQTGSASGLPAASADKIRKMVSFLQDMEREDELKALKKWKVHQFIAGDRKGTWALHVTGNWRITFKFDEIQIEIVDLNYEDYH